MLKLKAFLATLAGKIIAGLVLAVIILAILWLSSCQQSAQRAAQSRVDQGQAGALRNSATDAINSIGAVNSNTITSGEVGRQNEEDIRHAQGSDQPVSRDANAAGLRALCRRASHRDDPACRVQQPHPR